MVSSGLASLIGHSFCSKSSHRLLLNLWVGLCQVPNQLQAWPINAGTVFSHLGVSWDLLGFLPSEELWSRREVVIGITGVISARDRGKRSGRVVGSTEKEGVSCVWLGRLPREGMSLSLKRACWNLMGLDRRLSKS